MVWATFGSLLSPEGWLDQEAHESDLRGSRGVALAGALMIFMGLANFRHTVHPPPTRRVMAARRALTARCARAPLGSIAGTYPPHAPHLYTSGRGTRLLL
jgi:hypothetical protein